MQLKHSNLENRTNKTEDNWIRNEDLTSWWDTDHPPALSPNIVTWASTSKAKLKQLLLLLQLQLQLQLLLPVQSFFEEGPVPCRRQRGGYFPEPIQGQLPGPSIPGNDFLFQMHQPRLTLWLKLMLISIQNLISGNVAYVQREETKQIKPEMARLLEIKILILAQSYC